MPRRNPTPKGQPAPLDRFLGDQRKLLENLPAWLAYRGKKQKDVAAHLGTSDAVVSRYFNGKVQMTVGVLRQIAVLLQAHPGDLLRPPGERELAPKVEETLALMDEMTDEQWAAVLQNARMIRGPKKTP